MKILILVDSFIGGAGHIAQILARHFKEIDYEVYLLLSSFNSLPRYEMTGIQIVNAETNYSRFQYLSKIRHTRSLISLIKPSIIISFLFSNCVNVIISQWFTSVPIIVCERSNPYIDPSLYRRKVLRKLLYRRANIIIIQFDYFKYFDKAALRKGKILVIPNMILLPNHKKDYINQGPDALIQFVSLCGLREVKRLDLMINLFAEIQKDCKNSVLNIYGKGDMEVRLHELIVELGMERKIFLKGHTDNIHKVLSQNDVYLMTSLFEGFPNALGEAMAVGLPSVSFKCHDGLSELIQNGYNGYLIEEGKHNEFCEIAKKLGHDYDLRKKIGMNASTIVTKFEYCKVVKLWEDCINNVLS